MAFNGKFGGFISSKNIKRGSDLLENDHKHPKIAISSELDKKKSTQPRYEPRTDIMNHWLFADDPTEAITSIKSAYASQNLGSSGFATAAFKYAPIKQRSTFSPRKIDDIRKFLGLDDNDISTEFTKDIGFKSNFAKSQSFKDYEKTLKSENFMNSGHNIDRNERYKLLDRSKTTTDKVIDSVDFSEIGKIKSCLDLWNHNCIYTNYQKSDLSIEVISTLWKENGDPFTVHYDNAENFKFIHTHWNNVTIGGFNEVNRGFQQILATKLRDSEKRAFDKDWVFKKYKLYTLVSCRNYRKKISRLLKEGKSLKTLVEEIPLPNPINLLKVLFRSLKFEYSGKRSILLKILQGDESPDLPVVVRVESVYNEKVYISDGYNAFKALPSDKYIKSLFNSRKIWSGSKILLQGIVFTSLSYDEYTLNLYSNSVSGAKNLQIGLQPKHTNLNIRNLKYDGGKVLRIDVTVLKRFPILYRVSLNCVEAQGIRSVMLTEDEYQSLGDDPESPVLSTIDSISMVYTMLVIDTGVLLNKHDDFESVVRESCVPLTLKNVDNEVFSILKPQTRFVLTNTFIKNQSNMLELFEDPSKCVGNDNHLFSTMYSRLEIIKSKEHKDIYKKPLYPGSISCNLLMSRPTFSIHKDDTTHLALCDVRKSGRNHQEQTLYNALKVFPKKEDDAIFMGQTCDLNGIVIQVGDVVNARVTYFRFFLLTTKLSLVAIKVISKDTSIYDENGKLYKLYTHFERVRSKLIFSTVSVEECKQDVARNTAGLIQEIYNVQYAGFDAQCNIHNFQVNIEKLVLKNSSVLKDLQDHFVKTKLIRKGRCLHLSSASYKGLSNSHMDSLCRKLIAVVVKHLIKVYELVCSDESFIEKCHAFGKAAHPIGV